MVDTVAHVNYIALRLILKHSHLSVSEHDRRHGFTDPAEEHQTSDQRPANHERTTSLDRLEAQRARERANKSVFAPGIAARVAVRLAGFATQGAGPVALTGATR
jgi:hypothetical protein